MDLLRVYKLHSSASDDNNEYDVPFTIPIRTVLRLLTGGEPTESDLWRKDGIPLSFTHDVVYLRSSDKVVWKMVMTVATAESEVLKDLIDLTGGRDEIPVPVVSGDILSKVIAFCEEKHGFRELCNSLVDGYKSRVKSFVNTNRSILSDLHQAADFLNIQSLLDLTTQAVGDMMGRSVEEISECYARLSISQILSPLGLGGDVHNQGGGGAPMPLIVH